ncbi:hypothetical protein [uncultured Bradyrhizobium sp.]|jgi:predicted AlkP superfamily pyrophosphatase or phosphodiesterase|uniref:hypothetical protein n=1 Tax=uncultured Bradyrhizobium sp. TaxID=199684 RepID=UPI002627086E|nr:hypothetical protein [uncultured Bradyrhizobium sp.]
MTFEASPFREAAAAGDSASVARFPTEDDLNSAAAILLPAVESFALAKNVPANEQEIISVALHVVKVSSPSDRRAILRMDQAIVHDIQDSISHFLDIICLAKFIDRILSLMGRRQPDLEGPIAVASRMLQDTSANDRTPSMMVWPDMDTMVRDYALQAAAADRQTYPIALPEDAIRRVLLKLPVRFAQEAADGR